MLTRRSLLRTISALPLALMACDSKPNTQSSQQTQLLHAFGFSGQNNFQRIYAAGAPAEVLLYSLVPQSMLGWSAKKSTQALSYLTAASRRLPFLGAINGRGSTVSLETLLRLQVDLIVDVGTVDQTYLSTAQKISQQTNIPYLLIDGRLDKAAQQFSQFGQLINAARAELLAAAATEILQLAQTVAAAGSGKRIFYARGATGLETGLKNSIHTEVIELLGCDNVAAQLGEGGLANISMEQIIAWQPEIILTQDESFYQQAKQQPLWRNLAAVKNKQLFLAPKLPFGWLDGPPGINRLLGIYWLAALLLPQQQLKLQQQVKQFFECFYQVKLTPVQLQQLLNGSNAR